MGTVLTTSLCSALGIDHPVIQGPLGGPFEVGPELPAAVSNEGGLGSIATALHTPDQVRADIAAVRRLTERPFAVNVTRRPFDEAIFAAVLREPPPVVSLALGDPGDLVERSHAAGCRFVEHVATVRQAVEAAEADVDVIVAQGAEAGGFSSGSVGTMTLVPQIADAVAPVPVVAAGGITDGRGLAAALTLGADGVNVGTRFLASSEARIADEWKRAVLLASAEDAVKVDSPST